MSDWVTLSLFLAALAGVLLGAVLAWRFTGHEGKLLDFGGEALEQTDTE